MTQENTTVVENAPLYEGSLYLSENVDYFQNGDDFFVYHNLYGYILKMSEDLVDFLEFFATERKAEEMHENYDEIFGRDTLHEFLSIFRTLACLLPSDDYEREKTLSMYPTQARWITVYSPKDGNTKIYAFDTQTRRDMRTVQLNEWETALWKLCAEGNKTVQSIVDEIAAHPHSPSSGVEELVLATLAQWTHCELQVLKLSAEPCSMYKGRRFGVPPYLISTMPYERVTALVRTEVDESGKIIKPYEETIRVKSQGLKIESIEPEVLQKDRLSARLSTILAEPHEVLANESYAERVFELADGVCEVRGEEFAVLDIGGGLGETAKGFVKAFKAKYPDVNLRYTIYAPSEEFAQIQAQTLEETPEVGIAIGDPNHLADNLNDRKFDFILCDEFLANLESVSVRKMVLGGSNEEEEEEEDVGEELLEGEELSAPATERPGDEAKLTFIGEGDAIQQIFKHKLKLNDAPEDFYLNNGSLRLLTQIDRLCKFGTQVFLIEFGEELKYPVRTFEELSEAYSQHFGILRQAAENMGYRTRLSYWMEDLGLDRECSMFSTTRSQFKAMRCLFADHGIELERRPYTEGEMREILKRANIGEDEIVELNFEPAEDRISGLVPHSYKFLRIFKELEF
ncbi:MAG: hypothetical protein ACOX8U_00150 [Bradymonadia bacterium]|jgi:hypothetical protein